MSDYKPNPNSKNIKFGNIIKTSAGLSIILDDNMELSINGQKYKGSFINMQKPIERLNWQLEQGYITQDEYDERSNNLSGKVKYELKVKRSELE